MYQHASLLEVLHSGLVAAEEDDAGAGAPQAFVRRRSHDVGVLEGARNHAGCRQATEVRNVGKEVGVHLEHDYHNVECVQEVVERKYSPCPQSHEIVQSRVGANKQSIPR